VKTGRWDSIAEMFGAGTLKGSVAEEVWQGNKKSLSLDSSRQPGLSRLVSQSK
jgi:hypothetical protein